jgi:hypothetical protein
VTGHVFISFDRSGATPYADGLARYLTGAGLPVWYDREVGGEQRWAQAVAQIQACAAFIIVMTPGAEQSAWVTSEVDYAKQLGKPILPLLLQGAAFTGLSQLPVEPVLTGAMPSAGFLDHLRGLVGYQPGAPVAVAGRPRRTGLIIGAVAVGVIALVCVALVAVLGLSRLNVRTDPQTWQEKAAAIDGIQNYLVSHPDWYRVDPKVGNHKQGKLTYPTDPPAGGVHNPIWQNCMGDVYKAEIAKEHAMHSLEHGAVWITYRPDLPDAQVDKLAGKVDNVAYMLMSPYPGQDKPISLQAWGYQLKVDNASDSRIDAFIEALRQNATQEPQAACSGGITDTGSEPLSFP